MKVFKDYAGRTVRLTSEREAHILDHPEMLDLLVQVEQTISVPESVVRSASDATVELHYSFEKGTKVGDKWLCAVVKYSANDAFIVTAYLTDKVKKGEHLWPRK